MTVNDNKMAKLEAATLQTGTIQDLERIWLCGLIVLADCSLWTVNDLWELYLTSVILLPAGDLNDMQDAWLTGLGYTTGSLSDKFNQYWAAP